jgi:hypothetical protein
MGGEPEGQTRAAPTRCSMSRTNVSSWPRCTAPPCHFTVPDSSHSMSRTNTSSSDALLYEQSQREQLATVLAAVAAVEESTLTFGAFLSSSAAPRSRPSPPSSALPRRPLAVELPPRCSKFRILAMESCRNSIVLSNLGHTRQQWRAMAMSP